MRRRSVVAGTLVVLLSALDASAQTASVAGRVIDSLTSAPIVGATVSAINPGGSNVVFSEAVTDANGQYAFAVAQEPTTCARPGPATGPSGSTTSNARFFAWILLLHLNGR